MNGQAHPIIDTAKQKGNFSLPAQRISTPANIDWHMILDAELDQLEKPETGVLGNLGFTLIGSFLGLLVPAWQVGASALSKQPPPLSIQDVATFALCASSAVGGTICLVIYWLNSRRNKGIIAKIRNRERRDLAASQSRQLKVV